MRQRYSDYADYNIWANNKFIEALSRQNEAILHRKVVGSFPSISATILHIWYGETGWLSRLQGKGWEVSSVENFSGDFLDLVNAWKTTSKEFSDFVRETDLEREIVFTHEGESFSIPAREMAQTVFNHGSYHRGQIVMMMRQSGIIEIPKTDYIEWVREKTRAMTK